MKPTDELPKLSGVVDFDNLVVCYKKSIFFRWHFFLPALTSGSHVKISQVFVRLEWISGRSAAAQRLRADKLAAQNFLFKLCN